ncbi:RNA/RNP complex-1-interacting phosphatase-like [Conger conger]|uniref:RNA/RNP complex-1-interacting phosphatase-like n=1 Tax=Conger conger TaxID=82655 RepID=UPI002A598950|nr:RNA/RNP complex-1-interacting phosphatase-like [Conger conger]
MPPQKKNGIPDRWMEYQAVGKRIPGTRFIAFKVPLNKNLRKLLPPLEAFGPQDLVNLVEQEKDTLGLVIDLTFTKRYYKPEDLPDGVQYRKIFTEGHRVPSDPTILSFKRAVHRFLRENQDNDKLIGVHCTHGLNRTGYLVCRYLIDVEGMDPAETIELFNRSRGHSIERENYIQDLKSGPKRSNRGIEQPDEEPVWGPRPDGSRFVARAHQHFNTRQPFPGPYIPPYQMGLPPPMEGYLGPRFRPPLLPPYRTGPPRPPNQGPDWNGPWPPCPAPYLMPPCYAYGEPWQPSNGWLPPAGFPPGHQGRPPRPQRPQRKLRNKAHRKDRP